MIAWPMAALLGFVMLISVDIVLGMRATARFEFDRNRVQERQGAVAVAVPSVAAVARSVSSPAAVAAQPASTAPAAAVVAEPTAAASMAAHPAGKRAHQGASPAGWWLIDESGDGGAEQVLAGPFPDRLEADWAAVSGALPGLTAPRTVYGVRRAGGALARRPSPQEQAWLSGLSEQLDRLSEDWTPLLTDNDPLTTLAVEVTAALVEAGLGLHDCSGEGPAAAGGGVCLTPHPESRGILVSWHQHDRVNRDRVHGVTAEAAVQRLMNDTVAAVLAELGFDVESLGTGCHLVALTDG